MATPLLDAFQPLLEAAAGVDPGDPATARDLLTRRLDPDGERGREVGRQLLALYAEGQLAQRGAPPVRWGRVAAAGPETRDFSIDVVVMDGAGPRHRHPNGEINFCVPMDGSPSFVGQPPGWVVVAPGSEHVPEVEGGTMLIAYLLPGGAIEFLERA